MSVSRLVAGARSARRALLPHVGWSGRRRTEEARLRLQWTKKRSSASRPELMDRVQSRLQRLSMVVEGARVRLTHRLALSERVEADNGGPDDWTLPPPARPPGLPRHPVDLRRRLPARFALQDRGARDVVLRRPEPEQSGRDLPAAPRRRRRLRRHDPLHPGLVRPGPDPAAPPGAPIRTLAAMLAAVDRPAPGGGPALQPATCTPTPPRAK